MNAYAWANGRIDFGARLPTGALPIANASMRKLKPIISATSRLAYDGKTRLVPGVSESGGGDRAVDALLAYCRQVEMRLGRKS